MTLRVNQFKKKARIYCTLEIEDEYHFILIFTLFLCKFTYCYQRMRNLGKFI